MIVYYYEFDNDLVFKSDRENQKYFMKSRGGDETEIHINHKGLEKAFMHGDVITKIEYDQF